MPNSVALNGQTLNGQGTPSAGPTLPASSTGITFELSFVNLVPMEPVTASITFITYGDMQGWNLIPDGTAGIVFSANSATPIVLHTLAGYTGIAFSSTANISTLGFVSGSTDITFASSGTLNGTFHFSGSTGISFDTSGNLIGVRYMGGETGITFELDSDLWVNPQAAEDEDRTFHRPMTIKEFRRQ
jgi:hypothetical protein